MGNQPAVNRTFIVKAGMTPQDVINSNEATAQQKKMAYVFDSDGVAGYSQREADVFNATLITDRGQNGVSLWTRYKDGSKKETKYSGDISSFKFAPKRDVKPYVVTKKKATHATNKQNQVSQPQLSREEIIKLGISSLDGIGELKSIEGLDTLQFYSKEDSIAYDNIGRYYNGLWKIADKEGLAKWKQADKEGLAKWRQAEKEGTAKWRQADIAETEAMNKGDMNAVQVARKQKSDAIQEEQNKKNQAIQEEQNRKNQAIQEEQRMKPEARRTFHVRVYPVPYQIKDK